MTRNSSEKQKRFAGIPVMLQAEILMPLRLPKLCLIREITVDGALIELDDANLLPLKFELFIPSARYAVSCAVRHTEGQRLLDVSFETILSSADIDPVSKIQNKMSRSASQAAGLSRRTR